MAVASPIHLLRQYLVKPRPLPYQFPSFLSHLAVGVVEPPHPALALYLTDYRVLDDAASVGHDQQPEVLHPRNVAQRQGTETEVPSLSVVVRKQCRFQSDVLPLPCAVCTDDPDRSQRITRIRIVYQFP